MFTKPNLWVLHVQSLYSIGLDRTEINIPVISLIILLLVDIVSYKKNITTGKYLGE